MKTSKRPSQQSGVALLELALILPILVVLIFGLASAIVEIRARMELTEKVRRVTLLAFRECDRVQDKPALDQCLEDVLEHLEGEDDSSVSLSLSQYRCISCTPTSHSVERSGHARNGIAVSRYSEQRVRQDEALRTIMRVSGRILVVEGYSAAASPFGFIVPGIRYDDTIL